MSKSGRRCSAATDRGAEAPSALGALLAFRANLLAQFAEAVSWCEGVLPSKRWMCYIRCVLRVC